jgi:hypothetical protein
MQENRKLERRKPELNKVQELKPNCFENQKKANADAMDRKTAKASIVTNRMYPPMNLPIK